MRKLLQCAGAIVSLILLIWSQLPETRRTTSDTSLQDAANSTLGFQTILALSKGTHWRVHGLQAAANYTGLHIEVPRQSPSSEQAIHAFKDMGSEDVTKPSFGSAAAWLAHLDLLKHAVQSGFETALIIEDDMDWGVEIKDQMMTFSKMVRQFTKADQADTNPYGARWDLLWLGHCGEWWESGFTDEGNELLSWTDKTVGRREDWRGIYGPEWLMGLPEGHRSIFWSRKPICRWAYAVTSAGAEKIVKTASSGQAEAFDLWLREACWSKELRCISVVDQLFLQYRPATTFGSGSDIANLVDHADDSSVVEMTKGSTEVILHSARCKALFRDTCYDLDTMYNKVHD